MTRLAVYSRPGIDDACDLGCYEYNGSFDTDDENYSFPTDARTGEVVLHTTVMEAWAERMDCFREVLFVIPGYRAVCFNRTYL